MRSLSNYSAPPAHSTKAGNSANTSISRSKPAESGSILFETKAEVEILNSHEDDKLAEAMYGGAKRSKRKNKSKKKKEKEGVSGYDFDSLIR